MSLDDGVEFDVLASITVEPGDTVRVERGTRASFTMVALPGVVVEVVAKLPRFTAPALPAPEDSTTPDGEAPDGTPSAEEWSGAEGASRRKAGLKGA